MIVVANLNAIKICELCLVKLDVEIMDLLGTTPEWMIVPMYST